MEPHPPIPDTTKLVGQLRATRPPLIPYRRQRSGVNHAAAHRPVPSFISLSSRSDVRTIDPLHGREQVWPRYHEGRLGQRGRPRILDGLPPRFVEVERLIEPLVAVPKRATVDDCPQLKV